MTRRTWALVLAASCTPSTPAKFPDHDKVNMAHQQWCATLAELDGAQPASWRYTEACEAAYPTASSAFLQRFDGCYKRLVKDYGGDAPDSGALSDKCSQEILGGADPGDVSGTPLYRARCARQERCQQVSSTICDGAWARLDGLTQAVLSSLYNLAAQNEIASCLDDKACTDDEAAAEASCYDAAHDRLVWLPLSLEHDPSLGPKTD